MSNLPEDNLTLIGVKPNERRKLESMGFITLEQIALLDRDSLGMGKQRGDALIQSAWNILANRYIKDIEISENKVTVTIDKTNDSIVTSIKGILGAVEGQNGNCTMVVRDNKIILYAGNNPYFSFDFVLKNAKRFSEILDAKQKQELAKVGITLGESEIKKFAEERGFDGFWKNVFEEIKGNEIIKKALAVSMFSDFKEPVHVLIIGDPGSCKTLAKEIIAQNFKDVSAVGANSTRSGLVCSLTTGQLGVLAYSDRKAVLVDEFDKIPESDIEYCYELLSNGRCSVHSARIHQDIESNFIMIAFANPLHGVFKAIPIEEINLPPTLLSRFAFIIRTETLGLDERSELFLRKFYGGSELKKLPDHYNEWIKLARLHIPQLKVSEEKVKNYIKQVNEEIVEKYYGTSLRRDLRMGDYIRRIPISIAKSEFTDVTNDTLENSLEMIKESIETWKWV